MTRTSDRRIVTILTNAFEDNQSVNYIVKQDQRRLNRIRWLMRYAVATGEDFGKVWLSPDLRAGAVTILPGAKRTTVASVRRDVALALLSTGLRNVYKTLRREARIKALHPKEPFCHLWFLGVEKEMQGQGIGSRLLQRILDHYDAQQRAVYLETSTLRNVPWYEKFGFEIYDELNFSYPLYMMQRAIK